MSTESVLPKVLRALRKLDAQIFAGDDCSAIVADTENTVVVSINAIGVDGEYIHTAANNALDVLSMARAGAFLEAARRFSLEDTDIPLLMHNPGIVPSVAEVEPLLRYSAEHFVGSADKGRASLQQLLIESVEGTLYGVSTDGHRLVLAEARSTSPDFHIGIPSNAVLLLAALFKDGAVVVDVGISPATTAVTLLSKDGDTIVVSTVSPKDAFPNWAEVMPSHEAAKVELTLFLPQIGAAAAAKKLKLEEVVLGYRAGVPVTLGLADGDIRLLASGEFDIDNELPAVDSVARACQFTYAKDLFAALHVPGAEWIALWTDEEPNRPLDGTACVPWGNVRVVVMPRRDTGVPPLVDGLYTRVVV